MRGVNKVILVGTLGRDPETTKFENGGSITQFSIATSEKWNDKTTGEPREHTEWHRIVLNNRLGEVAQQYLRKGSKVYIEGSLRTRQWKDQNGQDRYTTEIRGDNMQMLDSRSGSSSELNAPQEPYGQQSAQRSYQAPAGQAPAAGGYGNNAPATGGYGNAAGYGAPAQASSNRPAPAPTSFGASADGEFNDDLPF